MSARRMILTCLAVLAVALVCAGGAMALPGLILESPPFGSPGSGSGQFNIAYGVAVNESSGNVYVSDTATGRGRIEEFGPTGTFNLEFGGGVVASGPDNRDEQQTVAVKASSGTFTLTFKGQTTGAINFNEPASSVQSDLDALSSIGGVVGGNVTVIGMVPAANLKRHIYAVTFGGLLAGKIQPLMTATNSSLKISGGTVSLTVAYGESEVCKPGVVVAGVKDVCAPAVEGPSAGQFASPRGIAVDNTCYEQGLNPSECASKDPSSEDVYVVDQANHRVQVFGPEGNFLVMFGGDVNATETGKGAALENVCTAASGNLCQTGTEGTGPGAFKWGAGNLIAVGSRVVSSKVVTTVYVGDENRVQEFSPTGVDEGEFALPGGALKTVALAIDSSGDVYAMNEGLTGVREYDTSGAPTPNVFDSAGSPAQVKAIAVTAIGDVIVSDERLIPLQGAVYKVVGSTVEELSQFGAEGPQPGAGFSGQGLAFDNARERLYVAEGGTYTDVEVFKMVRLPTARTTEPPATIGSTTATLTGEENPEFIDASGFFEYGPCTMPCGQKATAVTEVGQNPDFGKGNGYVKVEATVEGLQPNKTYHYRLVGHNINGNSPAQQQGTFKTLAVKPVIESRQALFLTPHTAELAGSVNPENEPTTYVFEYGPCASAETCTSSPYPETLSGPVGSGYGGVALYREIEGLQPSTTYHYRLVAKNNVPGQVESAEGTFTTPAVPVPVVVSPTIPPTAGIAPATGVSAGAATLNGEVDPNNAPTTYRFELAAGSGAGALYTTIVSGEAGSGGLPVGVAVNLAGLQPATTYSYRLVAVNAYGESSSAEATFTTPGFAAAFTQPIAPLVFVTPSVALPKEPPRKLTRAQKLARALKACAKKPKKRRAACRRAAQKRYGPSKAKAKKK
jgi:hypothetical protein